MSSAATACKLGSRFVFGFYTRSPRITTTFGPFSHKRVCWLSSAVAEQNNLSTKATVTFNPKSGAAFLTLPSTDGELRRFAINNDHLTTLAVLAENIKKEGIANDTVVFQSDAVKLANHSAAAAALSSKPLQILFDGKTFDVDIVGEPPNSAAAASGVVVSPDALASSESDLAKRAEEIRNQLKPMDDKVQAMLNASDRRTRMLAWVGLAYMATQFGFLARLTWWDYSWDIVEPITYFVTYGTGIFFYAYYVVTRQEANFAAMFDRQQLITVHRRITKSKFDLPKYNTLRDELHDIETQLRQLRGSVDWQVLNKYGQNNNNNNNNNDITKRTANC